jgi:hypothetical protein
MNTPPWPFCFRGDDRVLNGGPEPSSARHALTLEGEGPVSLSQPRLARDQCGSFPCLSFVRITLRDGLLRDAVRGKDYWDIGSHFAGCSFSSGEQFLREGLNQQGMVMPGVHEVEVK